MKYKTGDIVRFIEERRILGYMKLLDMMPMMRLH